MQSAKVSLDHCPACLGPWSTSQSIGVPSTDQGDGMLSSPALAGLAAGLKYARCARCGSLIAVDARRQPGVLDAIYRELPDAYWAHLNPQNRFAAVLEEHLNRRGASGDLWDIGCGTGTLLASLSDRWTKHGIEPGARAVAEAQSRGFDVRQGTAEQCHLHEVADVALLVDVIEHMPNPETELQAIFQMLRPGGTLAVFTGMADAAAPSLAGRLWYYLHCVGHVTVFSRKALCELIERVGLSNVQFERVEHQGAVGLRKWLARIAGNAARGVLGRPAAPMHFYRDHQLVLATKPR